MKRINFFIFLFLLIILYGHAEIQSQTPLKTRIEGHWNHPDNSVQTVYVVSEGEDVELFLNGISFGHGKHDVDSVYRFDNVIFQPGELTAVSYDSDGSEISRHSLQTAWTPAQLKLTTIESPGGFHANGTDTAIVQFEVTDFQGKRCGSDNRIVSLEIEGPAEWIDNIPLEGKDPNHNKVIKVKNGINSTILKSTKTPGEIKVTARAKGLAPVNVSFTSIPVE